MEGDSENVAITPDAVPASDTAATPEIAPTTVDAAPAATATTAGALLTRQSMWYVLAFAVVLAMGLVLWFFMEKDGRISTSVFSSITERLENSQPAAVVNGIDIPKSDFESALKQMTANISMQGLDPNDPTVQSELRTQTVESLVNTEILRQEALKKNIAVTDEQVEARYQEIATGIGGEETLKTRMQELSVTEEMLRRDISNDILIQAYLEQVVDLSGVTITDEEIAQLYEEAGGSAGGLPPIEEVRPQVEAQLRLQKEQELVSKYVETLREGASVEVRI